MGTGKLVVQVREADSALPLSGVQIQISDYTGKTLFSLTTDESGETEVISLPAVDRQFSLDPSYTGTPYSSYRLEAQAKGFNNLSIADMQIFDGENAIQPIALIPMLESQESPAHGEIVIGRHAVEMTDDREQEGPLISPFVFRQVVIPNPITVHLGSPASSAYNVQVPFIDYIKNVASSEIYPTWPQASLEANIYAIITFALNRVFTQWYRSRGYNFDITNNTAYDQYYVHGRTIYESISKIVDNIFNQYVRLPGQVAPFFTSFCNGTTSTCPGLSQWGTVSLANQGRTSLQILRYYYPNNVEISETNIITGIVTSFPGTTLSVGSTGAAVESIQVSLNRIRRNYPAIPLITDNPGVFGNTTRNAVMKFQEVFNLTVDGVVGKATWNSISKVYVAVARLAELDSEGTALGIGSVPPSTVLRTGSSGVDVITLQYILNFIRQFHPVIPALTQDGIFGRQTTDAVMAFQRMMNLSADGIVGAATWLALYDVYWGIRGNVPIPPPPTGTIEYVVARGDSLWSIAQRFNTTVAAIKTLNNLASDALRVGQILLIPFSGITHTVVAGDTLWQLAQRYGTTVNAIRALNGLTSNDLRIGQVLRIPR